MLTKPEIIQDYCTVVKKIVNYLHKNSPNDKSETYRGRALIFINNTPGMVLELTGPLLFKRNKAIQRGNPGELIKEMIHAKAEINKANTPEEDADYILHNIISILEKAPAVDKKVLVKDLQYITKLYIQFLILEKQ